MRLAVMYHILPLKVFSLKLEENESYCYKRCT